WPAHVYSFQHDDGVIHWRWLQIPRHDRSGARVPTQQRLIIISRPNIFCRFVASHCLSQEMIGGTPASGSGAAQLCAGLSLVDDALIVHLVVLVIEARHKCDGTFYWKMRISELIGQRQQKQYEGRLVLRIDLENVEADAFGLCWLIQEPVPFGAFERRRNRQSAKTLEFKLSFERFGHLNPPF